MGSYVNTPQEIADAMSRTDLQGNIEGDFYEEDFIKAAKIYIRELRKEGAYIHTDKLEKWQKNCPCCGKAISKTNNKCRECRRG